MEKRPVSTGHAPRRFGSPGRADGHGNHGGAWQDALSERRQGSAVLTQDGHTLKKLLILLLFLGLALAAGVYGLAVWSDRMPAEDAYTLAPVEFGRLAEVVSATGILQPRDTFVVGTQLSGKVIAVHADFNQVVEEDDVLLRLDDRLARQQLKQAQLGVEAARVALKKAEADREAAAVA